MDEINQASKRLKTVHETFISEYQQFVDRLESEEKKIEQRYESLEQRKKTIADANGNPNASYDDLIEVNAGGKIIAAKRGTLCQIQGTRLEALFCGRWDKKLQRDGDGRVFLDVNSEAFQSIVDYLNERAISPSDNPPKFITTIDDGESQHLIDHLLELFTVKQSYDRITHAHAPLIHDWLKEDGSDGEFKLLYRSSRDGLSNDQFHTKCDNRGCTLTVIETTGGLIVGGYSNTPWANDGRFCVADKAFLFVLSGQPCKMKLKRPSNKSAVHHSPFSGPVFGKGPDLAVCGSKLTLEPFSYDMEPFEHMVQGQSYVIKELEVFQVNQASTHSKKTTKGGGNGQGTTPMKMAETSSFTTDINAALNAKLQKIKEAELEICCLENQLDDQEKFIDLFAIGETKDVVKLNVSGTQMATKRSTLMVLEESVLARQFDDSKWTEQGNGGRRVMDWTPDDVFFWAQSISDISDDVARVFVENKITGNELLALEKDGLMMIGIKRAGTLFLLLKEIKKLEKASQDVATLIEHSPSCFGKILDFLRMKQSHSLNLAYAPELPNIRESERCRFEKVVQYYFPGECAESILGMGMPITIKMAQNALVDPNSSDNPLLKDSLKDGRPLRTVTLVAAVRSYEEASTDAFLMDVEDGTGHIQVEGSLKEGSDLSKVCKEHSYVRVIGQVEDFGGQRHILATAVRMMSSGDEMTDHFIKVAQSYDKYLRTKELDTIGRGTSSSIRNQMPNTPTRGLRRIELSPWRDGMMAMDQPGSRYGFLPGRNLGGDNQQLNNAVRQCIRILGPQSDSGAHIEEIIRAVSAQGFVANENIVRHSLNYLSNEGRIYSTIDEEHFQYNADSDSE